MNKLPSLEEQITGRVLSPEERLYALHGGLQPYEPEYQRLFSTFRQRFTDVQMLSDARRSEFTVSRYLFTVAYCKMDAAFGDTFRSSIDAALPHLAEANDHIISAIFEEAGGRGRVPLPVQIVMARKVDRGEFYSAEPQEIERLQAKKLISMPVIVHYGRDDLGDAKCVLTAGNDILLMYLLTPKTELERVRLPPGYEQRTYHVQGTTTQLDTLEKIFAYMQQLGNEGHSETIMLSYDGDGNARMGFARADGEPLMLPTERMVFIRQKGLAEEKLSPDEFLRLAREHRALAWKEGDTTVSLHCETKEKRPRFTID